MEIFLIIGIQFCILCLLVCYFLTIKIRYGNKFIVASNFTTPSLFFHPELHLIIFATLGIKLLCFYICNLHKGMWRYTSITDVFQILKANLLSTTIMVLCSLSIVRFQSLPLEILFIDFVLSILFTSSSRLGVRLIYSHLLNPKPYRFNFRKS